MTHMLGRCGARLPTCGSNTGRAAAGPSPRSLVVPNAFKRSNPNNPKYNPNNKDRQPGFVKTVELPPLDPQEAALQQQLLQQQQQRSAPPPPQQQGPPPNGNAPRPAGAPMPQQQQQQQQQLPPMQSGGAGGAQQPGWGAVNPNQGGWVQNPAPAAAPPPNQPYQAQPGFQTQQPAAGQGGYQTPPAQGGYNSYNNQGMQNQGGWVQQQQPQQQQPQQQQQWGYYTNPNRQQQQQGGRFVTPPADAGGFMDQGGYMDEGGYMDQVGTVPVDGGFVGGGRYKNNNNSQQRQGGQQSAGYMYNNNNNNRNRQQQQIQNFRQDGWNGNAGASGWAQQQQQRRGGGGGGGFQGFDTVGSQVSDELLLQGLWDLGLTSEEPQDWLTPNPADLPDEDDSPKYVNGKRVLVNSEITASRVRVQNVAKEDIGIMSLEEAQKAAAELTVAANGREKFDVVLINDGGDPPVVRLVQFSKYKYELEKSAKQKQKASKGVETKELRLRPVTEKADYETKMRQAQKFLGKGNKVKLTMTFSGREMRFKDQGKEMMLKLIEDLSTVSKMDAPLSLRPSTFSVILSPLK